MKNQAEGDIHANVHVSPLEQHSQESLLGLKDMGQSGTGQYLTNSITKHI